MDATSRAEANSGVRLRGEAKTEQQRRLLQAEVETQSPACVVRHSLLRSTGPGSCRFAYSCDHVLPGQVLPGHCLVCAPDTQPLHWSTRAISQCPYINYDGLGAVKERQFLALVVVNTGCAARASCCHLSVWGRCWRKGESC